MRQVLAWLCLTSFSWAALPAHAADPRQAARDHSLKAKSAFEAGDYEGAVDHYNRAQELFSDVRFRLNLGVAHENLGRLDDARENYDAFLRSAPVGPKADVVREKLKVLDRLMREKGKLIVSVEPAADVVLVDGRALRLLRPVKVWLAPGPHHVEAQREGYANATAEAQVRAGLPTEIRLNMQTEDGDHPAASNNLEGEPQDPDSVIVRAATSPEPAGNPGPTRAPAKSPAVAAGAAVKPRVAKTAPNQPRRGAATAGKPSAGGANPTAHGENASSKARRVGSADAERGAGAGVPMGRLAALGVAAGCGAAAALALVVALVGFGGAAGIAVAWNTVPKLDGVKTPLNAGLWVGVAVGLLGAVLVPMMVVLAVGAAVSSRFL